MPCTRTILNFQSVYTIKCRNKKRSTKRVFVCAFNYGVLMFIRREKSRPVQKLHYRFFKNVADKSNHTAAGVSFEKSPSLVRASQVALPCQPWAKI